MDVLQRLRASGRWKAWLTSPFKKEWWQGARLHPVATAALVLGCIVLIAAGYVAVIAVTGQGEAQDYTFRFRSAEPQHVVKKEKVQPEKKQGDVVPRRLDGMLVKPTETDPQPVAVMIENLSVVRPQHGLQGASVVYETLAEGGITRFMAMFPGGGSEKELHPVRSARPYYLEWAAEYDAMYVYAGGSPTALQMLSGFHYKDLNALSSDGKYFWRGPGFAPHNLYTSSEKLAIAMRDKGWDKAGKDFVTWDFQDGLDKKKRPTKKDADKIEVLFSGAYNVRFEYDQDSNRWLRFNGGAPHQDANTGQTLAFENVIIQRIPAAGYKAEYGRRRLQVAGEGQAWVCREGRCTEGRWKKPSRVERTVWLDKEGKDLPLTRGKTWVIVVPEPYGIVAGR